MALFTDRAGLRMDMGELMVGLRVWGIDLGLETVRRLRTAVLLTVGVVSPNPLCACPCSGVDRLHTVSSALRAACARCAGHRSRTSSCFMCPSPPPLSPFELTYWGLLRRWWLVPTRP